MTAKTFGFKADEIAAKAETYEGYCAVAAEVDRFRRAHGMRTGLNLTRAEMVEEAVHWAKGWAA